MVLFFPLKFQHLFLTKGFVISKYKIQRYIYILIHCCLEVGMEEMKANSISCTGIFFFRIYHGEGFNKMAMKML